MRKLFRKWHRALVVWAVLRELKKYEELRMEYQIESSNVYTPTGEDLWLYYIVVSGMSKEGVYFSFYINKHSVDRGIEVKASHTSDSPYTTSWLNQVLTPIKFLL